MLDTTEVQLLNGMLAGRLVVAGYEVAQHLCNTGCRAVGSGMCEKQISQQVLAQVGFYDRVTDLSLGLRQRLLWVKEFRLLTAEPSPSASAAKSQSPSVSNPSYLVCVIDPARSFFWHWCGPGVGGSCGVERERSRSRRDNSVALTFTPRPAWELNLAPIVSEFAAQTEQAQQQSSAPASAEKLGTEDEAIRLGRLVLLASEWQLGSSFVEDDGEDGEHHPAAGANQPLPVPVRDGSREIVESIMPYLDLTLRYGDGVILFNQPRQHHHRHGYGRENYYYRVATVQEQLLWEFQLGFEQAGAGAGHVAADDYQTKLRASSASSDVTTTAVPNTAIPEVMTSC